MPAAANRQLIGTAEMEDLLNVEITPPKVFVDAKSRQEGGAESRQRSAIENIYSIGQTIGPGKVPQRSESVTEPALPRS